MQLAFTTAKIDPSSSFLSSRTPEFFSLKSLSSCHLGVLNLFVTWTWPRVLLNLWFLSSLQYCWVPFDLSHFKKHYSLVYQVLQVSLICKLAKELHPTMCITRDLKKHWFKHQPWWNAWQHLLLTFQLSALASEHNEPAIFNSTAVHSSRLYLSLIMRMRKSILKSYSEGKI